MNQYGSILKSNIYFHEIIGTDKREMMNDYMVLYVREKRDYQQNTFENHLDDINGNVMTGCFSEAEHRTYGTNNRGILLHTTMELNGI